MSYFYFSYSDLFAAYEDCLRHKRNSPNAIKFMMDANSNVIQLCDEINNGTYEIGQSIAFIITYPKCREVFAADFRDRIVHHLVINELMPYFERYFIKESFSCMKGKGTLYGIRTMAEYIRKKECLRWLCKKIIMHKPEDNCIRHSPIEMWDLLGKGKSLFETEEGNGLAIGNLTSQMFANFYMTILDYFIKYYLGFEYYGRYVDDFMLYHNDKEYIKECIPKIKTFTNEALHLNIHPDKLYLQEVTHGVKFIGSDIMPHRLYCGNRTIGAFYNKLMTEYKEYDEKLLPNFVSCVNSYLGFMKHYSTYNMRKEILTSSLMDKW